MKQGMTTGALAIAALAFASPLTAHHSISMFDISKPIWIKGTVTSYQVINPHARFGLEEKGADGQVRQWAVEGPGVHGIEQRDIAKDFLKVGDIVEVCGFAFKEEVLARSAPETRTPSRPFLHGHVLVMPDGKMRLFGGYGKLENCIRPDDRTQAWVDFLNTDSRGRDSWCVTRRYANVRSIAPTAFVDEIDRRIANPCN